MFRILPVYLETPYAFNNVSITYQKKIIIYVNMVD